MALTFFTALLLVVVSKNDVAYALDYVACGDATGIPKPVPQMTTIAYTLLLVGAPLALIIAAISSLTKAISSGNQENVLKAKDKLFKKFFITGFVFLVAGVVQFTLTRVTSTDSDKNTVSACLSCFLYYNGCEESDLEYSSEQGTSSSGYTDASTYDGTVSHKNGNYLKYYNALTILHSGQIPEDNTVSLFENAGQAHFYGAECDLQMHNNTLYCYHNSVTSNTASFAKYMEICKKYNMIALLDLKGGTSTLDALAKYVKANDAQKRIIVQTSSTSSMQYLTDKLPGTKYWYLIMSSGQFSTFSNVDYKKYNITGVNVERTISKSRVDTLKSYKNKGLEVCVFSWAKWSDSDKKLFSDAGVDYIMTNSA